LVELSSVTYRTFLGRPRKKPPLIPTNLEATPDEPSESDEQKEKRKRGRPKKLKIAEITITTQTLGEAVKLQSPQKEVQSPSTPSTPTTPTPDKPKRGRGRPRKIRPAEDTQGEDAGASVEVSASSNGYLSPENSMHASNNENMSPEDSGVLNMENHVSNYTTFSENSLSITEDMLEECIPPPQELLLQSVQTPVQPVKRKRGKLNVLYSF
jgi:hypothetical protein